MPGQRSLVDALEVGRGSGGAARGLLSVCMGRTGAGGCALVVAAGLGRGPGLVGRGLLRVRRIKGEGIVGMQRRIGGRGRHVT